MGDGEYEQAVEETKLNRLLRVLADKGVLSDRDLVDLAYPSLDAIEEAQGEIL